MPDEADPGVDKFDLLAAINSSGETPAPLPEPIPEPAPAVQAPAEIEVSASAAVAVLRRPPSVFVKHRQEISALVAAFVAIVWLSVGIASRAWGPSLVGVTFGVGALLIGAVEIWADE